MKQLKRSITHTSRSDRFTLYPIGDIHVGAAACNEKLFKQTVAYIQADPTALVVLMGDMIDGVGRTGDDFRFRQKTIAPWLSEFDDIDDVFDEEVDHFVGLIEPIADKVIAIVNGNHEDKVEHKRGVNVYWSLVDRIAKAGGQNPADLGIGYDGFLRLKFIREVERADKRKAYPTWTMDTYVHHGFSGGRKPGSKANNMFDLMGHIQADLYLMGHTHDLMTVSKTVVIPTNDKLPRTDTRWGVVCGSFLNGFIEPSKRGRPRETYAEFKGMPSLPTGHPVIHIEPGHSRYSVEMNMNTSLQAIAELEAAKWHANRMTMATTG